MIDIFTYLSFLLFMSPILIGIGAFAAIWLRDEFYEHAFYDDYDEAE